MDIGYWAKHGELIDLHQCGCPIALLTAMLLVVLEGWFRGEMLVKSAVIVRDRTTKFNCRCRVERVEPTVLRIDGNLLNYTLFVHASTP
ncbi:Dihydroorotate dehydrogenase (fumarate) [Fusarium oxysporum f. sp. albedinis]|nr:Dihydroorotate dehydrogenase (fumarate) [Fusarium oxysporum f. sp. albedinis]